MAMTGGKDDGSPIIHHGVSVRAVEGWSKPMVRLRSDSQLVIRYRLAPGQEQAAMKVMISTVTASGGFGGNFEAQIESDHRVADANGWCTARLSMKQMTSLHAAGASSPAELDVTQILLFTFWANVQLALSEITVESGSAAAP